MNSKWKTGGGQAGQQGGHLAWGGRHWAVLSVSEFPWRGNSRSSLMCQPEPRPSPRDYSTGLKMNCQFPSHCPLLNFSHFSWWWFNIIFSCSDSSSLSCGYLCVWGFKDGFHVRPKLVGEGEHWEERGEICFFFMMILAMFTWNWLICPGFLWPRKSSRDKQMLLITYNRTLLKCNCHIRFGERRLP